MNEMAIEARDLTKNFSGLPAVSRLDLSVPAGTVLGLIGRNGAGKTTLIRLLMGLLRADGGTARVLGMDMWHAGHLERSRVAYVPQAQQLHAWMTLEELCHYASLLYGRWDASYARSLADKFGLAWGRQIGLMSGGQQRKAAVVLAFATRAEALLLDEPAAELDPIARRESDRRDRGHGRPGRPDDDPAEHAHHQRPGADRRHRCVHGPRADRPPGQPVQLQGRLRRVQVIFDGPVPPGFELPGAVRVKVEGSVLMAVVDVASETQLDAVRRIPETARHGVPAGA